MLKFIFDLLKPLDGSRFQLHTYSKDITVSHQFSYLTFTRY